MFVIKYKRYTLRDSLEATEIYERVDKLRIKKGWTLYKLSKEACISITSIYRWRDKQSVPSIYLLENIANALGVSLICLLYDTRNDLTLTEEEYRIINKWRNLSENQRNLVTSVLDNISE